MRINYTSGTNYNKILGPWQCEKCHHNSQFAETKGDQNHIFCENPYCGYRRIVDMKNRIIVENDGSVWVYDPLTSKKVRVNSR